MRPPFHELEHGLKSKEKALVTVSFRTQMLCHQLPQTSDTMTSGNTIINGSTSCEPKSILSSLSCSSHYIQSQEQENKLRDHKIAFKNSTYSKQILHKRLIKAYETVAHSVAVNQKK